MCVLPGRVGMVYAWVMVTFSASVEGMAGGMYSSYIPLPITFTVLEGAPVDTYIVSIWWLERV